MSLLQLAGFALGLLATLVMFAAVSGTLMLGSRGVNLTLALGAPVLVVGLYLLFR